MLSQQFEMGRSPGGRVDYTDYLFWKMIVLVSIVFVWKFLEGFFSGRRPMPPARSAAPAERTSDSPKSAPTLTDLR